MAWNSGDTAFYGFLRLSTVAKTNCWQFIWLEGWDSWFQDCIILYTHMDTVYTCCILLCSATSNSFAPHLRTCRWCFNVDMWCFRWCFAQNILGASDETTKHEQMEIACFSSKTMQSLSFRGSQTHIQRSTKIYNLPKEANIPRHLDRGRASAQNEGETGKYHGRWIPTYGRLKSLEMSCESCGRWIRWIRWLSRASLGMTWSRYRKSTERHSVSKRSITALSSRL